MVCITKIQLKTPKIIVHREVQKRKIKVMSIIVPKICIKNFIEESVKKINSSGNNFTRDNNYIKVLLS